MNKKNFLVLAIISVLFCLASSALMPREEEQETRTPNDSIKGQSPKWRMRGDDHMPSECENIASPKNDDDRDQLTNYQECEWGSDPQNSDTDGDGINDGIEMKYLISLVDPNQPLIDNVEPAVVAVGDTLHIFGDRLTLPYKPPEQSTKVFIRGIPAVIDPTSQPYWMRVRVPAGAENFKSPSIKITVTYATRVGSLTYTNLGQDFSLKVVGPGEIAGKKEGTTNIKDGDIVYNKFYEAGKIQAYQFHIPSCKVADVSARSFDPLNNGFISGGGSPDLFLEVIKRGPEPSGFDDDASVEDRNPSISELALLDAGTWTIKVSSSPKAAGPDRKGFYQLKLRIKDAPYFFRMHPAIGKPGESVTISGCNLGNGPGKNSVKFRSRGSEFSAPVTSASNDEIKIKIAKSVSKTETGYQLIVRNLETGLDSENQREDVKEHNKNFSFYVGNAKGIFPEDATGSNYWQFSKRALKYQQRFTAKPDACLPFDFGGPPCLAEGATAMGHTGQNRGKFTIRGEAGRMLEVKMNLLNINTGEILRDQNPSLSLFDQSGSLVPHYPGFPSMADGILHDKFTLPADGYYTLQISGAEGRGEYYALRYVFSDPDQQVDGIEIISGDNQYLTAEVKSPLFLSELKVRVTYHGEAVPSVPVIFETSDKIYLSYSDDEGYTAMKEIISLTPSHQGTVTVYPAHRPDLKVRFNYVVILLARAEPAKKKNSDEDSPGQEVTESGVKSLEFIPIDPRYPALARPMVLYVMARDQNGDYLPGAEINFTASDGPGRMETTCGLTDQFGIASAMFVPDATCSANAGISVGKAFYSCSRLHTVTASAGNISSSYNLNAIPNDPSRLHLITGDTVASAGYPYQYLIWARVLDQWGNPVSNADVTFLVNENAIASLPQKFRNAAFSFFRSESRNYPRPVELIGSPFQSPRIKRLTNEKGYAYAGLVMGNTDNFNYRFQVKARGVEKPSSASIHTISWDKGPYRDYCYPENFPQYDGQGNLAAVLEKMIDGNTLNPKTGCFRWKLENRDNGSSDCVQNPDAPAAGQNRRSCAYKITPLAGVTIDFHAVIKKNGVATEKDIPNAVTNTEGIASIYSKFSDGNTVIVYGEPVRRAPGLPAITHFQPLRTTELISTSQMPIEYYVMKQDGRIYSYNAEASFEPVDLGMIVKVKNLMLFDLNLRVEGQPFLPGSYIICSANELAGLNDLAHAIIYSGATPFSPASPDSPRSNAYFTLGEFSYFLGTPRDSDGNRPTDAQGGNFNIKIYGDD